MVVESLFIKLKEDGIQPAEEILEYYKNFKLSLPGCVRAYYASSTINKHVYFIYAEFETMQDYEHYRDKVNEKIQGKMPLEPYFANVPKMGVFEI